MWRRLDEHCLLLIIGGLVPASQRNGPARTGQHLAITLEFFTVLRQKATTL